VNGGEKEAGKEGGNGAKGADGSF